MRCGASPRVVWAPTVFDGRNSTLRHRKKRRGRIAYENSGSVPGFGLHASRIRCNEFVGKP